MNLVGRNLKWKEIVVMGYAGLRGAISLSLAIYVRRLNFVADYIDPDNFELFKIYTILYTISTILWTVLLQGLSIKFIINSINFVKQNLLSRRLKLVAQE